jgi:hypothetical protein
MNSKEYDYDSQPHFVIQKCDAKELLESMEMIGACIPSAQKGLDKVMARLIAALKYDTSQFFETAIKREELRKKVTKSMETNRSPTFLLQTRDMLTRDPPAGWNLESATMGDDMISEFIDHMDADKKDRAMYNVIEDDEEETLEPSKTLEPLVLGSSPDRIATPMPYKASPLIAENETPMLQAKETNNTSAPSLDTRTAMKIDVMPARIVSAISQTEMADYSGTPVRRPVTIVNLENKTEKEKPSPAAGSETSSLANAFMNTGIGNITNKRYPPTEYQELEQFLNQTVCLRKDDAFNMMTVIQKSDEGYKMQNGVFDQFKTAIWKIFCDPSNNAKKSFYFNSVKRNHLISNPSVWICDFIENLVLSTRYENISQNDFFLKWKMAATPEMSNISMTMVDYAFEVVKKTTSKNNVDQSKFASPPSKKPRDAAGM